MAQAHRLLGARVSIIQRSRILSKDDPELTYAVRDRLIKDGVDIYEDLEIISVEQEGAGISVKIKQTKLPGFPDQLVRARRAVPLRGSGNDMPQNFGDQEKIITGSHLLVAVGRKPDIENLNLNAAQINFNKKGIVVDQRLRSTNKKVYVVGDVAGGYQFTHVSSYHASIVLRNILFHLPAKTDYRAITWVTYTNPELAHVGLYEDQARTKYGKIKITSMPFSENDRAQAEGDTTGLIKVISKKNGEILSASIVGDKAGELIDIWCLAINKKLKMKDIASCIIPYPTRGEISKQVAGAFYAPMLFSDKTRKLVRFLLWLLN
jgi:pyruvate/2-oxoglutarate dehydrogenase complex dihydrolipoamide dehydrogenase (E3) component